WLAARFVDARIERRVAALDGISGERAGDERRFDVRLRAEQPNERQRGRNLRAVEEGKAFLGFELDGLKTGALQGVRAADAFAVHMREAFTDENARHMRQRRQIARRADGACRGG